MHIYHYAHYEIAVCRRLMGRYGVCEEEVDQLLRNEVFVDLYKIVKRGLLVGTSGYSLKDIECLYREKRETKIGGAKDSIVAYERWRELYRSEQGDTWQTSTNLRNIRDYNIDDCNSTQELVEWLRIQQQQHGIEFLGKTQVTQVEIKEKMVERIHLRDRLLHRASKEAKINHAQASLSENLAWILEFHRREAKPIYWRLFDRLDSSPEELLDDIHCLSCCQRTQRKAFKPTPRARNLAFEYRFDPMQEFKGASQYFYLLGVTTADGRHKKVRFDKEQSDLENGIIVVCADKEPPEEISLIPDEHVLPGAIPQAIYQFVSEYELSLQTSSPGFQGAAMLDFLRRDKPRIEGHHGGDIVSSQNSETQLKQIIDAAIHLDRSYLTIQGPPGAGKSYTAEHIVARLLKSRKHIGISSNSPQSHQQSICSVLPNTAKNIG